MRFLLLQFQWILFKLISEVLVQDESQSLRIKFNNLLPNKEHYVSLILTHARVFMPNWLM